MATFRRFPPPQKGRPWENIPGKGEGGVGRNPGGLWAGPGVRWVESEPEAAAWVPPVGAGAVGRRGSKGARRAEHFSVWVEGGALQPGPWLCVLAAGAAAP